MRFLSWECWDFWRQHDHFRRFPKKSKVFRRSPKSSEDVRSLRTRINASSHSVLFNSKIRDREKGIVISSFYTWFSFLTWVRVNIFLEIVSSKTATSHIFLSGVRNWPASVSRREIEVFNPQAWDSHLRRESWQVYVPYFYRVIETRVEVWENEKCCGNTNRRRVFPQLSRVLPDFHERFCNSIETRGTCFYFS